MNPSTEQKRGRGRPAGSSSCVGVKVGDIVKFLRDDFILPIDRRTASALFRGVTLYQIEAGQAAVEEQVSPSVSVTDFD